MASGEHIRGMLLEEVILALLRRCGFSTITNPGADRSLSLGSAGMLVHGRGARHQIDAIADFRIVMPFAHPPRLLVEAKFVEDRIDLATIRNSVGVLKDVSEFYVSTGIRSPNPRASRVHYQFAVFSVSDFTKAAQDFAFAHDIFVVPLTKIAALVPVLTAIQAIGSLDWSTVDMRLRDLRVLVRRRLQEGTVTENAFGLAGFDEKIETIAESIRTLGGAFLARTTSGLPLFLVPVTPEIPELLIGRGEIQVGIRFDRDRGWWLEDSRGKELFEFDLPEQVFRRYDRAGNFRRADALRFKLAEFPELHALHVSNDGVAKLLVLQLDPNWVQQVRHGLEGV